MREVLGRIATDGTPVDVVTSLPGFGAFLDFIGLPEVHELDRRFAAVSDANPEEER